MVSFRTIDFKQSFLPLQEGRYLSYAPVMFEKKVTTFILVQYKLLNKISQQNYFLFIGCIYASINQIKTMISYMKNQNQTATLLCEIYSLLLLLLLLLLTTTITSSSDDDDVFV